METTLNKSLHDAAELLFKCLNSTSHCVTEETNISDDTTAPSAPVAKRQKLSTTVTSEVKKISLRKGHFYVFSK